MNETFTATPGNILITLLMVYIGYKLIKTLLVVGFHLVCWRQSGENNIIKCAIDSVQRDKVAYRESLMNVIKQITPDSPDNLSNETLNLIFTEVLKRWDHSLDANPKEKDVLLQAINKNNPGIPYISDSSWGYQYASEPWVTACANKRYPTLRKTSEIMLYLFIGIVRNNEAIQAQSIADLIRLTSAGGSWARTKDDIVNAVRNIWYYDTWNRNKQHFTTKYLENNRKQTRKLLSPIVNAVKSDPSKFRQDVIAELQEFCPDSIPDLSDDELGKICSIVGCRKAGSLSYGLAAHYIASLYHQIVKQNDADEISKTIQWMEDLIKPPKAKE